MKCFHLALKQRDPTTLEINLTTSAFLLKNGELVKLVGKTRDFQEADILDFEREVGSIVGISYNDIVHGDAKISVEEVELPPNSKVVKIINVEGRPFPGKARYFVVLEARGDSEQVIYTSHRARGHREELKNISKELGISDRLLRSLVKQEKE